MQENNNTYIYTYTLMETMYEHSKNATTVIVKSHFSSNKLLKMTIYLFTSLKYIEMINYDLCSFYD